MRVCHYKLNMLNSTIGKEKFIYDFEAKNTSEQHNLNLDCVVASDIEVDETNI